MYVQIYFLPISLPAENLHVRAHGTTLVFYCETATVECTQGSAVLMDLVVYLALGVLIVVFAVSLVVLIFMCRRRMNQLKHLSPHHPKFVAFHDETVDGVSALSPLIQKALDKNSWMYDVTGLLQHCVALLRLCHNLSEKLSSIPLQQVNPQLNNVLCEATHRVLPRFDDLLCAVASPHVDVRILEARATALATVCWALLLPFTIVNPKYSEMLGNPLKEMDTHLEILRQAADLAERSDMGKVNVDWARLGEPDEEAEAAAEVTKIETTPLVDKSLLQQSSEPVTVPDSVDSSQTNGNAHPVDPSV